MLRVIEGVKTYWFAMLIGIALIVMLWLMSDAGKDIAKLESDVATTQGLVRDSKKTLAEIDKDFDKKAHQEKIAERTVSAKEIGEKMIAVDNELTAFYKTNEPLPTDEKKKQAIFAKLEQAKKENTRLTGAGESDHIITWQLNPEWTLKLETVVTFQDTDRVPVLFSMTTKDGKRAGLIYAMYNTNEQMLENISRHYTVAGLNDETDVGGL